MSMKRLFFVSYASGQYTKNIIWNKLFVSFFLRPDRHFFFTKKDLVKSSIYGKNKKLLDSKIGGGYWAWKPWAILQAMEHASAGDVVIYQDCGFGLKYKNFVRPNNVVDYALKHGSMPGVFVPIHGENAKWTHDNCFRLMGCDQSEYFESPQVEASISAWCVNDKNKSFVAEWLSYCLDISVVGNSRAIEESNDFFIHHRHDQSVLTNLVIKHRLKPLTLSFDDMHFSKSLSLVDLDLSDSFFPIFIRDCILFSFRLKSWLRFFLLSGKRR